MIKKFWADLNADKWHYLIIFLIILSGIFLRTYRLDQTLWFFYDQGRDALVIHDLIYNHKFFLIGPTTGIEGIFIGPFFYFLLIPGYFFSGGDPASAGFLISSLNGLGVIFIYLLAKQYSKLAGILAAFVTSFSFTMVRNDRWLANPSPLSFFAPLTLFMLWLTQKNSGKYAFWAGLLLGLNLQLEASGATFCLIAALVWAFLVRLYKNKSAVLFGVSGFVLTLLPQIFFELKHNFLITKNLIKFLSSTTGSTAKSNIQNFILERGQFLYQSIMDKFEPNVSIFSLILFLLFIVVFFLERKVIFKNNLSKLLLLWITIPFGLMFFYRGNYGFIYSYYLDAVYPAIFIMVGVLFSFFWKKLLTRILLFVILAVFFYFQYPLLSGFLNNDLKGENIIALGNQKQALDYIYQKAQGRSFNVDVYVPPVIPYTYNYLFLWYGNKRYGYQPEDKHLSELYTISEYDDNLKRRDVWFKRQDLIGKVIESRVFGGILVQKRERILY